MAKAFFNNLPADELTPVEDGLRKALLKALQSMGGKPFPLIEWIDLRIGGEVEAVVGQDGHMEVQLRGQADVGNPRGAARVAALAAPGRVPPAKPEAFLKALPTDRFYPLEDVLRDAVFEFLATWTSQQLATLVDLQQHQSVQHATRTFLPKNVQLKDWIEHRIGAEIEFRPGQRGGPEVLHLTEQARAVVLAKYQQLSVQARQQTGSPAGGHGGAAPPHGGLPQARPPHSATPRGGAQASTPPLKHAAKEEQVQQFWASLPEDSLLPKEHILRDAILDWLGRVASDSSRHGAPAHLSDAGNDKDIKQARQFLLTAKAKLSDWIDHRIGGEVELRAVGDGQFEVILRDQTPPASGSGAAGGEKALSKKEEATEKFFAKFPEDEFTDAEDNLRLAMLSFLDRWAGQDPPAVSDLSSEEEFKVAKKEVIPKGSKVSLKEWVDRRIGGEIETQAGLGGNWIFGHKGTLGGKRRRTQ